jgi:DNA polymerase-4
MDAALASRKIIHVDMDAFYASVEQLDDPSLRNKPIAVGGGGSRGVVAAASYEARKYGVRSAMSGIIAQRNCPHLIFVKPRFERYKAVSQQIRVIFHRYTDLVEPLSLDEAYLDVTENKQQLFSATKIAEKIRAEIFETTGLTASAGISINKLVAKIASDYNKPNGQKTVPPEEVLNFLEVLDVRKYHGIGKVTTKKMYALGIFTGKELKEKSVDFLTEHFGKAGSYYYNAVRGIHTSPVKPSWIPKSMGAERTFRENLTSELFLEEKIKAVADELEKRINRNKASGKTITLKIKYSDFVTQTRSKTLPFFISDKSMIIEYALQLLYQDKLQNSVRLIGVTISNLNTEERKAKSAKESQNKLQVQLELPF